jgi:hypothetical protein
MQALQHNLVRLRQNIEVGRWMLYDTALLVDAGQGDNVLDRLTKPCVSEMAVDVVHYSPWRTFSSCLAQSPIG